MPPDSQFEKGDGPGRYFGPRLSLFVIDSRLKTSNNDTMSTETPATSKHELENVIARMMTGQRDPDVGKKAREDMDRMREETRKRIGMVDVAVQLIRDARNQ